MVVIKRGDSWLGVSITATDVNELHQQLSMLRSLKLRHHLLIEWRLDYWRQLDIESLHIANQLIRQQLPHYPLLLTLRTVVEGGRCQLNATEYTEWLLMISHNLDWDLLDVMSAQLLDPSTFSEQLDCAEQQQLIYSYHHLKPSNFAENCAWLNQLAQYARPQDLIKLAVQTESLQNSLDLLNATLWMNYHSKQPLITMGMGQSGQITRQLGPIFGSVLSFGSLVSGGSAPGQLPLLQLDQLVN